MMGYPMSYQRMLGRSGLYGGEFADQPDTVKPRQYSGWETPEALTRPPTTTTTKGDLRRLEHDQRDERHLAEYARRTGLTPAQCRAVLDAFFDEDF